MSMEELDAAARELLAARARIAELKGRVEALSGEMKREMRARGTDTLYGDGWKASWKEIQSVQFDSQRFREENAGVYSAYSRMTTTKRFSIRST